MALSIAPPSVKNVENDYLSHCSWSINNPTICKSKFTFFIPIHHSHSTRQWHLCRQSLLGLILFCVYTQAHVHTCTMHKWILQNPVFMPWVRKIYVISGSESHSIQSKPSLMPHSLQAKCKWSAHQLRWHQWPTIILQPCATQVPCQVNKKKADLQPSSLFCLAPAVHDVTDYNFKTVSSEEILYSGIIAWSPNSCQHPELISKCG